MSAASWGLVVPAKGDPITPFRTPFVTLAESMATALDKLNEQSFPRYATRSALPSSNVKPRQHATVYADPTAGNNGDYYWNGTSWVAIGIFAEAAGTVTLSSSVGSGQFGAVNVTFPSNRFTQPPILSITPSNSRVTAAYSNKTTTGFRVDVGNWSGATANQPITFDWMAKQMTAASAAG